MYTSINSVSKNLGATFLPPALKIHNYFDNNEIFHDRVEIIRNELIYLWILSMCKVDKKTMIRN